MVCLWLLCVVVADMRRPVDDISERSSETTEHDRSEVSLSESFEITSEEDTKITLEDIAKHFEESAKDTSESESEEESKEEAKDTKVVKVGMEVKERNISSKSDTDKEEVKEVIEQVRVDRTEETARPLATKITEEERTETLQEFTEIARSQMAEDVAKKEDSLTSDDNKEEVKEEVKEEIVKSEAAEQKSNVDIEKLEELKEEKDKFTETVVLETLNKPPLHEASALENQLEVATYVKKPKSVTESESEAEEAPGNNVIEMQEEEYIEGEVKITKKTVSHSSHTSTVVKGTPKITETVTVIREVKGPETLESTTKGKSIQQFTSTVSGVEAEERMAKLNRLRVEGQAREVTLPEMGGQVKESRVKMLQGSVKEPEVTKASKETLTTAEVGPPEPKTETDTKKVGPDQEITEIVEETTAMVKTTPIEAVKPDTGGNARKQNSDEKEDDEEELEFSIKPELIPWMTKEEAPDEAGDVGIMYETDKTIKTEEMQILDEVTVETKILEVKTIKMELSRMGDVSVLETTEVRTDTDMKENRQSKEREETIYLHTRADAKKPPVAEAEKRALTAPSSARLESGTSGRSESESETDTGTIKRRKIPVLPKGAKLSDSPQPRTTASPEPRATTPSDAKSPQPLPARSPLPTTPDIIQTASVVKQAATPRAVDKDRSPEHSDEEPYLCVAVGSYDPVSDEVLSLHEGEQVEVLDDSQSDWWLVRKLHSDREGWVPGQYLRDKTVYDRIVQRQLQRAIEQLPASTSKIQTLSGPIQVKSQLLCLPFAQCKMIVLIFKRELLCIYERVFSFDNNAWCRLDFFLEFCFCCM